FLGGEIATVTRQDSLENGLVRYWLQAPALSPGVAELSVVENDGRRASRLGAVQYVEPLILNSLNPSVGSVNGGTRVTLQGRGFESGALRTRVYIGDSLVADAGLKVLSPELLEFVTPPGQLGLADIRVELDNGQQGTLPQAFLYQQPVKANIEGDDKERLFDLEVDPSGTYMFAAAGNAGVIIYNIDSSTYIGDTDQVTNPDDLRGLIDRNGDKKDDRIVASFKLPGGYAALGVRSFFERGKDRLFVTAARLSGSTASDARLFILAVDSEDIREATLVRNLPLPADYAKGLVVENNQALVAMAGQGLGVVDSYLHTKAYLTDQISL